MLFNKENNKKNNKKSNNKKSDNLGTMIFKDTIFEPLFDKDSLVRRIFAQMLPKSPRVPGVVPEKESEDQYQKHKAEVQKSEDVTDINRILDAAQNTNDILQETLRIQEEIIKSVNKLAEGFKPSNEPPSKEPPSKEPPKEKQKKEKKMTTQNKIERNF